MQTQPMQSHSPTPNKPSTPHRTVVWASLALFVLACSLPALTFAEKRPEVFFGGLLLGFGWMGSFVGQFGWFANVFYGFAMLSLFFRRWLLAAILGLVGVGISFHTFAIVNQRIPKNEAATSYYGPVSFGPGVYVWIASLALLVIGAVYIGWSSTPSTPPASSR